MALSLGSGDISGEGVGFRVHSCGHRGRGSQPITLPLSGEDGEVYPRAPPQISGVSLASH